MEDREIYTADFVVNGHPFRLSLTNAFQFILENRHVIRDAMGYEEPGTLSREESPGTGLIVYRKAFKLALNVIFSRRLHYFFYTTGMDDRRKKLYARMAKRLVEKYGFKCYEATSGCAWFFYREYKGQR